MTMDYSQMKRLPKVTYTSIATMEVLITWGVGCDKSFKV